MKVGRSILVLACLAVVLSFWRSSTDVFDVTKATVLWLFALLLLPFLGAAVAESNPAGIKNEIRHSAYILQFGLIATISTLVASDFVKGSVMGEANRLTGLSTILAAIVLGLYVRHVGANGVKAVLLSVVTANFLSGLYVLAQNAGRDPYQWQSGSFGDFVFGTMGNPNFASVLAVCACTLSVLFMLDPSSARFLRSFAGVSTGLSLGMLGIFDSFQGNVALLPALLLIGATLVSEGRSLPVVGTSLLAGIVAIGVSFSRLESWTVMLLASILGIVGYGIHDSRKKALLTSAIADRARRRWWIILPIGIVLATGFGFVFRSTISSGFSAGFVERGDFYRAAWEGIKDRPLLGFGLDTFAKYFTEYRPVGHALGLENNRTSSVHSVFLGMLFSGGVFLFLSFMILITYPIFRAMRVLKAKAVNQWYVLAGALAAFVSLLVTFLVSTEHVAIYAVFFVVAGSIVALTDPPISAKTPVRKQQRTRLARERQRRRGGVVVVLSVVSVALIPLMTRPFRASLADFEGQVTFFEEDYAGALSKFVDASSLAPWVSNYQLRAAEVAANLEQAELARAKALEVGRQSNYIGGQNVKAAQIIAFTGDLASAIETLELTFDHDPFALNLGRQIEELATTIEEVADREGMADVASRARTLIDRIVETRNELTS